MLSLNGWLGLLVVKLNLLCKAVEKEIVSTENKENKCLAYALNLMFDANCYRKNKEKFKLFLVTVL